MRLLYLTDDVIHLGGAVREHVNAICKGFQTAGHHVTLVCPEVIPGGDPMSVDRVITYGQTASVKRAFRMVKAVREVLNGQSYDAIYMRYRASQLALYCLRVFRQKPRFLECNGIPELEMNVSTAKRFFIRTAQVLFERPFFRSSRGFIAVTKQISHYYEARYGLEPKAIRVFNNGVWPDRYEAVAMDRTAHPITLGFVGNVAWWQGLDTVVRGITSPDFQDKFRLVVVGDGEYLPKVRELAAGAPNVIFTGSLPGKEIPSVLKTFNVGVVSKSIRGEGLSPLKLYEYWAAGLPVLATNLPGLDIVEHVKGGALYEMDDVDSFKSALSYMVGQRDRWADWGQNGRTYVCEHASWARIGMDTATFVSSLV